MDIHPVRCFRCRAFAWAPALLLAAELVAAAPQQPDVPPAPALAAGAVRWGASGALLRTAFGAAEVDGEVVAGGPDWKARFPAGRVVFTPALGTRAERNLTFAFAFGSLARGSEVLVAATGDAQAALTEKRVSFAHAQGLVERYDATQQGLELSFLVPERPAGAGDLLVRGRIETDLLCAGPQPDGGLSFERPGVGGVRVGGVTAIDAAGAAIAGELRLDGDTLELVVPGAFADAAVYPLVIDPEIGPVITVDGSDWDDVEPAVAASSHATARYLAVWVRRFSLSDRDVRAALLDEDGGASGGLLMLESGDEQSSSPAAAFVRLSERFLVVWQEKPSTLATYQIVGRGVEASGGALSSKLTLAPSANEQLAPDVGGERTLVDDDVLVVWGESVGIRGRQISLPTSGATPFPVGSTVQLSDPLLGDYNSGPVLSKSAGDAGRFGLCYQTGAWSPTASVSYRTLSRDGTDLSPAKLLSASLPGPHTRPAIDGDGTHFMLVFERGEPLPSTTQDVWGAAFTDTGTVLSPLAFQPVEGDAGDEETRPDVAFTGGQFIVSYIDVNSSLPIGYAKTVDPYTCLICEEAWILSPGLGLVQEVKVAAHYASGLDGDEALCVWETNDGDGDILAQLVESPLGQVDQGGGCGQGGVASTPCPYAGNPNFAFHLSAAEPFVLAFLVLGFQQQPTACGPCTLWPSLATADVFFAGVTDQYGRASLPVALPTGTSGVTFISQWGVAAAGGACPFFDVDVSNGVRTTVKL